MGYTWKGHDITLNTSWTIDTYIQGLSGLSEGRGLTFPRQEGDGLLSSLSRSSFILSVTLATSPPLSFSLKIFLLNKAISVCLVDNIGVFSAPMTSRVRPCNLE